MLSPVFAVTLALFAQAPTAASPAPAAAPPAGQAQTSNVICHTETDTGTRFGHRVCHTPEEWRALSSQASDYTSKMQQMGGMTGGPH